MNKYSPEQITGRLRCLGWEDVPGHERIYQYVYADKRAGGLLYKHLRCQKSYRKRGYANQDRRGQLTERVDIEHRPVIFITSLDKLVNVLWRRQQLHVWLSLQEH